MDHSFPDPKNTDSSTEPPDAPADLSRTAVAWALALLAGVGLATWSAGSDRQSRTRLEQAAESTAVGDSRFFTIDAPHPPTLVLGGTPLVLASKTPEPMSEARMRLDAYTDDASFRLYVPLERSNGDTEAGGPSWYIKAGPSLFLRLTR